MPSPARPVAAAGARPRATRWLLAAFALLGFGVAVFADHIVSYYLIQWAPSLRRFPSQEERTAVLQALSLDRATHLAMWAALAGSLLAWRSGHRRRERPPTMGAGAVWLTLGASGYALTRVVVESQLAIDLVRVPNAAHGIDWHGPGFGAAALALLVTSMLAAVPKQRAPAVQDRPRR